MRDATIETRRTKLAVAALLFGAALLAPADRARAATAEDSVAAVRACVAERDDARRLACFDRAAATLPDDARLATPAPAAPAMTPEERFGYRGDVAREEHARREAEDKARDTLDELQARVVRVSAQPTGDFVVTLDNGQVWAQVPVGAPKRLRAEDAVTIKRASLGSFLLTSSTLRGVRVRRVK